MDKPTSTEFNGKSGFLKTRTESGGDDFTLGVWHRYDCVTKKMIPINDKEHEKEGE